MTRKDYELLAEVFASTRPTPFVFAGETESEERWALRYSSWETTIRALCDRLERDNPRFDRSRFQYAATNPKGATK